jgi:hypothetical protein
MVGFQLFSSPKLKQQMLIKLELQVASCWTSPFKYTQNDCLYGAWVGNNVCLVVTFVPLSLQRSITSRVLHFLETLGSSRKMENPQCIRLLERHWVENNYNTNIIADWSIIYAIILCILEWSFLTSFLLVAQVWCTFFPSTSTKKKQLKSHHLKALMKVENDESFSV